MPDQDGYPTDAELARVRDWPVETDPTRWLAYIRSLWWAADWGWPDPAYHGGQVIHQVSTGGWSGNEELITVMRNHPLWGLVWESSRRGGHYEFRVPVAP